MQCSWEKGIIAVKLRNYLKECFPERHQQIHTHVMSIDARALVGMLFTPGLLEEEVEQIVNGREGTRRKIASMRGGDNEKEEKKSVGGSSNRD